MKRWAMLALMTLVLCAGCSGKDFEHEILGQAPPPTEPAPAPGTEAPAAPVAGQDYAPPPAAPAQAAPVAAMPAGAPAAQAAPAQAAPAQAAPVQAAPVQAGEMLTYQTGSFAHEDNASSLAAMLSGQGYQSRVEPAQVNGKAYFRVVTIVPGPEYQASQSLAALGVSGPRLLSRSGAASGYAQPAPAPAMAPAPAQTSAPAMAPAPVPASPAPQAPQTPPASPAPSTAPAPQASGAAPGGFPPYCLVGATRIEAVGKSPAGQDALMARKTATQDAKRNLLVCIDAYQNQGKPVAAPYKIEAYLPDNLVQIGEPVSQSDGGLAVRASIAISDVGGVSITRR